MDNLLKGNYDLYVKGDAASSSQPTFEEVAMRRLGGSIAFFMKGNQLVWEDETASDVTVFGETTDAADRH